MKLLRRYNFLELLGAFTLVLIVFNAVGVMATTLSDGTSTFTGSLVMPEDGFIGLGLTIDRLVFDGTSNAIRVEAVNIDYNGNFPLNLGDPGTDFDEFGGLALADNLSVNNLIDMSGDVMQRKLRVRGSGGGNFQSGFNINTTTADFEMYVQSNADIGLGSMSTDGNFDYINHMSIDGATGNVNHEGNDVSGVGTITSTKSTSGAHDPPFRASDGEVYTSYGMVATTYLVRSSVTQAQLVNGEYFVDFLGLPVGSEFWRFYEEVDLDTLRVMITPLDDCGLYYSYSNLNSIRFVAMSGCNNLNAKFNFELSARRYDWKEWPSQYDVFGDEAPSWLQDTTEYSLGENVDESMRYIWNRTKDLDAGVLE